MGDSKRRLKTLAEVRDLQEALVEDMRAVEQAGVAGAAVCKEGHDKNKTAFAEIHDWRKHVDMEISSLDSQVLHLQNAVGHFTSAVTHLQTQIDCCFPKPGPYGWLIILAGLVATSVAGHVIFHGLFQ